MGLHANIHTDAEVIRLKLKLTPQAVTASLRQDISPSLVEVDKEHHIITETGKTVGCGHGDDEGKDIVDESVKGLKQTYNTVLIVFTLDKLAIGRFRLGCKLP